MHVSSGLDGSEWSLASLTRRCVYICLRHKAAVMLWHRVMMRKRLIVLLLLLMLTMMIVRSRRRRR